MTRVHQLLPLCLLPALACVEDGPDARHELPDSLPRETTEALQMATNIDMALQRLTDSIIDLPGVTGTAVGECNGQACITVLLETKTEELLERIPKLWEGYTVKIEESGTISPRGTTE